MTKNRTSIAIPTFVLRICFFNLRYFY